MSLALTQKEETADLSELKRRLELEAKQLNRTYYSVDFGKAQYAAEAEGLMELTAVLNVERLCHSGQLVDGKCSLVQLIDGKVMQPIPWGIPEKEACAYLLQRYKEATNQVVKLRYGLTVLYCFKGPHTGVLAKELVDVLVTLLQHWEGQEANDDPILNYHDYAGHAFLTSQQYDHRKDEVQHTLFAPIVASTLPFFLRHLMLRFFASNVRKLTREACGELDKACVALYEQARDKGEGPFMMSMICDSGATLAGRASAQPQAWYTRKADSILEEAKNRLIKEPDSFIVQTLFDDALKEYRRAGNAQRVAEIEALVSATKPRMKMSRVRLEKVIDGDVGRITTAYMKAVPKFILEEEGNPFWRIALSQAMIPSSETHNGGKDPFSFHYFRTVNFDINSNVSTRKGKADAQEGRSGFKYNLSLAFTKAKMSETIRQGILSGQITYDTMVDHLTNNTWLGEKTLIDRGGADDTAHSWVDVISPALRYCFDELTKKAQQEDYKPEMMLCMDSLVLKFEQMLRNFCLQVELPTSVTGKDNDMRERYIEEIIDQLGDYADKDSLYLIRFVLTKTGWNLRNNIAHAFLSPSSYNPDTMSVVLLVLLIIASMGATPTEPV